MDSKNNQKLDEIASKLSTGQQELPEYIKFLTSRQTEEVKVVPTRRLNLVNRIFEPFWLRKDQIINFENAGYRKCAALKVTVTSRMIFYIQQVNPDFAQELLSALKILIKSEQLQEATVDNPVFDPITVVLGDLTSLSSVLTTPPVNEPTAMGKAAGDYQRMCLNFFVFLTFLYEATERCVPTSSDYATTIFLEVNNIREALGLPIYGYMPKFSIKPYEDGIKVKNSYLSVEGNKSKTDNKTSGNKPTNKGPKSQK